MRTLWIAVAAVAVALLAPWTSIQANDPSAAPRWDTYSDTWVATDGLGRSLPTFEQVGAPRKDRTVGIFYFLWLGPHVNGGPYDIPEILKRDAQALQKRDSPLWGPLYAPHHWGEALFGYYLTDDRYVLRKHAQMLSDAGVDAVIFDASNKLTYRPQYTALLNEFAGFRARGGRPPSVAFLCPFWDPESTARQLYHELYAPTLFPDLWLRWDGKPLILADPSLCRAAHDVGDPNAGEGTIPVELAAGHSLSQTFHADAAFDAVGGRFPTWATVGSGLTLTLRAGGPQGRELARRRVQRIADNAWVYLEPAKDSGPWPPGDYCLEASDAVGRIGWWTRAGADAIPTGIPLADDKADGRFGAGDRTVRLGSAEPDDARMRSFFTYRAPQPSYFVGPVAPDMWGWLEVYPQHVFRNARGEKEQMTVGVAQNAVNGALAAMSDPDALGRSYHAGHTNTSPGVVRRGLNFAEQSERALKEAPRFVFITGWNEWIAGRFDGKATPVSFVDEFDEEHSRDIEPMRGGHGDDYYYQMVAFIRRYKGVRPLPAVSPRPILVDGRFDDWKRVGPEFRDTIGDPARRDHPGWNDIARYRNETGRNDIIAAKISYDRDNVYLYVRTNDSLTSPAPENWMTCFLDIDGNPRSGWLGYDIAVGRRTRPDGRGGYLGTVERAASLAGHDEWKEVGAVRIAFRGAEMEIGVPRRLLFDSQPLPAHLDFKWADNCFQNGDWTDFTLNGDAAPNDRFNYRGKLKSP
jgi:hypothetical protein